MAGDAGDTPSEGTYDGGMADLFPVDVYDRRLTRAAELCREEGLAGLIIGAAPG